MSSDNENYSIEDNLEGEENPIIYSSPNTEEGQQNMNKRTINDVPEDNTPNYWFKVMSSKSCEHSFSELLSRKGFP